MLFFVLRFVEGLLQKSSEKFREEQNLNTIYFIYIDIKPEESHNLFYKLCHNEDISTINTDLNLCIYEILSLDEFVERYK
jgi:hypothetical protein